jgi:hypothetical protein
MFSACHQGNHSGHQVDAKQEPAEERVEGDADVRVERKTSQELLLPHPEQLLQHPTSLIPIRLSLFR